MKKYLIFTLLCLLGAVGYAQRPIKQMNQMVIQLSGVDTLEKRIYNSDSIKIRSTADNLILESDTILINGYIFLPGGVSDTATWSDTLLVTAGKRGTWVSAFLGDSIVIQDGAIIYSDNAESLFRLDNDSINFKTDSIIIRNNFANGGTTTSNSSVFTIYDAFNEHLLELKSHGGVGIGYKAGNDDNSADLVAIGWESAKSLTNVVNGHNSIYVGAHAGANSTTGINNVYLGEFAGSNDQTAQSNTYVGANAGSGTLGQVSQFNIGVGSSSLANLSTGDQNTFMGYLAGNKVTSGALNTGIGNGAGGFFTNWATGNYNTSVGANSNGKISSGANNTSIGSLTGEDLLDGSNNTFLGYFAGGNITSGASNIFLGYNAGSQLTTESNLLYIDNSNTTTPLIWGDLDDDSLRFNGVVEFTDNLINYSTMKLTEQGDTNIHIGLNAGNWGNKNIFIGEDCGTSNTGNANFIIGYQAMAGANTANQNVGIGSKVFNANTSGAKGVFLGHLAGQNNSTGSENIFVGKEAGGNNQTGTGIVAVGTEALEGSGLWSQSFNTAIGHNAGQLSTVDSCIYIGAYAGENNTVSQRLMIDNSNTNTPLIDGNFIDDELTINGDIVVTDSIYQNGMVIYRECKNLADEGTWDLGTSITILGTIFVDADNEYATFTVQDDATVTLVNNLGSVVNTNTDTNLCIFDNGTNARISNRLGSAKDVCIDIAYKQQ